MRGENIDYKGKAVKDWLFGMLGPEMEKFKPGFFPDSQTARQRHQFHQGAVRHRYRRQSGESGFERIPEGDRRGLRRAPRRRARFSASWRTGGCRSTGRRRASRNSPRTSMSATISTRSHPVG
jgi:hypothetical protein